MKAVILSYSFTGNNEALAKSIAGQLNAEHLIITEPKKRTFFTIVGDIIFMRTPKVAPSTEILSDYDFIIFVAPVWMGQPVFPLRAYFKQLKKSPQKYAFISVSGGANTNLSQVLKKKTGIQAEAVINFAITELLPSEPKPTLQEVSEYKLTEQDIQNFTNQAVTILREKLQ